MAAWDKYKSEGYDYDAYFTDLIAQFDQALAELE